MARIVNKSTKYKSYVCFQWHLFLNWLSIIIRITVPVTCQCGSYKARRTVEQKPSVARKDGCQNTTVRNPKSWMQNKCCQWEIKCF